jgi:hypothetical protein
MIDLDALEALLAKASECQEDARIDCKDFENAKETMADILRQDIAKSVPSLIAELRELREATHWRPITKIAPLTDEQADALIAALTDPPEAA